MLARPTAPPQPQPGRRCTDVAAVPPRPGPECRLHHEVPGVVDGGGQPCELLAGQGDPHRAGPAWRNAGAPRRPGPRRPACLVEQRAHALAPRAQRAVEKDPAVHRLRRPAPTSSRQVPPPPPGPGQATLIPMPITTADSGAAGELRPRRGSRPASTPPPGGRWAALSTGSTPATSRQASAAASATAPVHRCTSPPSHRGRNRIEASRFAPGVTPSAGRGAPRPAVWWSATATRPSGAPSCARSRT